MFEQFSPQISSATPNSQRPLVCFIVAPVKSHIYSSLGVARRLQDLGCEIQYWGDSTFEKVAIEQGFGFRRLQGFMPRWSPEIAFPAKPILHPIVTARKIKNRREWRRRLPDALREFGGVLDSVLDQRKPDLVVFDPFRLGYYPFFHRRSVPTVVLSTKALLTWDPEVPPHTSNVVPSNTVFGRQRVRAAWTVLRFTSCFSRSAQAIAGWAGVYTYEGLLLEAGKACGFSTRTDRVQRWISYDLHFKSVTEWALWTPEMDFPRTTRLPSNVRYIGPCVDSRRKQPELEVHRHASTRYLIYVAMGTAETTKWRAQVRFLSSVILAFKEIPRLEVVISTGDEKTKTALGTPPSNVRVFSFVPQLAMLNIADLVISHAGAGTLRECILKEVPLLAYPREFDQAGNAARVVYFGIGLRGNRTWDTPGAIRRKAFHVLENRGFRDNIRGLKSRVERSEVDLLKDSLQAILSNNANLRDSAATHSVHSTSGRSDASSAKGRKSI